jgi:hypothetical protein
MSRFKLLPYALFAALTVAPACGGDDDESGPSGNSGSTLTTAEFDSMVEALSVIGSLGIGFIGFDRQSPNLAAQTQTITVPQQTENCPSGGTTGWSGTYTITQNQQGVSSFHYVLTQTYSDCRAQSSNGTTWTFNGNPNITVTMDYSASQAGNITYTVRELGGFSWSGAGKSSSCQIDVTISGSINSSATSYTYTYTGSVCGQSVNESYTYGA